MTGCSGVAEEQVADDETPADGGSLVELPPVTDFSYLPLMTIELYADWNAGGNDNVFLPYGRTPAISYYTINPISATTGASTTGASVDDYNILEDGVPVNPKVNFPMLQPIVGNQIILRTAIVINTSSTMDSVDRSAFISEIKDYVTQAKASSTSYIADQEFTVWGFSGIAVEETGGATGDEAAVLTALDTVSANWANGSYESEGANHTYDAIFRAIGRYNGAGEHPIDVPVTLRDADTFETNDLVDFVTPDFILASSIILFSAGYSSSNQIGEEFVVQALESQSNLAYDAEVEAAGTATETKNLGKPLIYVVPAGESEDPILASKASSIIKSSTFAESVVSSQIEDLNEKFALGNQHVLRWASAIRSGSGHSLEVSSRTAEDKFGYKLSVEDFGAAVINTSQMPDPQVEITGANNEYIATNIEPTGLNPYDAAINFSNLISTFYPATRWTNQVFTSADYTWGYSPANSMVENADGSVSIANGAAFPITLTLTNNNIQHDGAIISDNFTLTIQASN